VSRRGSAKQRAAVAHVLRRLSMGPQPDLAATLEDADAAICWSQNVTGCSRAPGDWAVS